MSKQLKKGIQKKYPWWDSYFLLEMGEDWLKRSSDMHTKRGNLIRSDRTAKEMKIAHCLINRIREKDYSNPNKVLPCRNKHIPRDSMGLGLESFDYNPREDELKKQDVGYLFDFMKKHILGWWD